MGDTLRRLKEEARRLDVAERLELVTELLQGLDYAGPFEAEWAAEAEERLSRFRSGELESVPLQDVIGPSRQS